MKPSGSVSSKNRASAGASDSPAQPKMIGRGLGRDNQTALLLSFQLLADAFGRVARAERSRPQAMEHALGAEIHDLDIRTPGSRAASGTCRSASSRRGSPPRRRQRRRAGRGSCRSRRTWPVWARERAPRLSARPRPASPPAREPSARVSARPPAWSPAAAFAARRSAPELPSVRDPAAPPGEAECSRAPPARRDLPGRRRSCPDWARRRRRGFPAEPWSGPLSAVITGGWLGARLADW